MWSTLYEHPFMCFLIICQYSIEKSPPRSYIHLLIGLFVFWYLAPWAVWIFWRLILCHLHNFRILSPILWVFFCLVYDYLCCAEAKFNWIPLAYFCFYFHYSKVSEKTYCCDLCQRVLCLCFPLRVLWGLFLYFSSVQSLSRVWLFATRWIPARQASLSIPNSRSSLKLMSIESMMPSSHLILCCPLLLLPPSLLASECFPMSQLFTWGGQSTGVSALASFLPKKSQGWSPLE